MSLPDTADWIMAAFAIWSDNDELDVYISLRDKPTVECDEPDEGAWVTGARVWVSREQLDAFIKQQAGGPGPLVPEITYTQLNRHNA